MISNDDGHGDERTRIGRLDALEKVLRILPGPARPHLQELFHASETDPAREPELFSALRSALNSLVEDGALSRRDFLQIAGLVFSGGLAPFLYPEKAQAWQSWTGFWQNTQNNPAATYTGTDPYWDYVVLLMNMDGSNGSTVFADESNVGKNPTIAGAPYIDTSAGSSPYSGVKGTAAFNGSSDYLDFGSNADFAFGTGDLTIEAWVYPTTGTGPNYGRNFFDSRVSGGGPGIAVGLWTSTGNAYFSVSGGSPLQSLSALPSNQWSHIAVVRSAGALRLYVNGISQGQTADTTNLADSRGSIGALSVGPSDFWQGSLSDLRVYKGVAKYTSNFEPRSAPIGLGSYADPYWGYCVLACPFENTLKDCSGKRLSVSGGGNLSSSVKKFGTASASFDASGQAFIASASDLYCPGDFTIEGWIYLTAASTTGFVLTLGEGNGIGWPAYSVIRAADNTLVFRCSSDNSSADIANNVSFGSVALNTWYHFAVTRSSSTWRLFLNGALTNTFISALTPTNATLSNGFSVGADCNRYSTRFFSGCIDSLRITKGYARYTSNFTPPSTGFPIGKDETVDPFWSQTVLAMHMDDLADATGRHAITNNNSVSNSTATYRYGSASALFNGSNSYLSVESSSDFAFGTGDFTVEFWGCSSSAQSNAYAYATDSTGGLCFGIESGMLTLGRRGTATDLTATYAPPVNAWVHYALTRQNGRATLFVGGRAVASGTNSLDYSVSGPVDIGAIATNAGFNWNGYLDDLRITKGVARYVQSFTPPTRAFATTPLSGQGDYDYFYDKVVLLMHMDDANFNDQTGRHTTSNTGAVSLTSQVTRAGSSASFSGSNYLTSSSSSDFQLGSSDFTIEAWYYPTALTSGAVIFGVWTGGLSFALTHGTTSGSSIRIILSSDGSTITSSGKSASIAFTLNCWQHLALVRSGSGFTAYVNGANLLTVSSSSALFSSSSPLSIGGISGYCTAGYLDELRVTKDVARYTSNFAPPVRTFADSQGIVTSSLVAYLDAGECQSTNAPLVFNSLGASQQFNNSSFWLAVYSTLTPDSAAAPDGTSTATLFLDNSSNQVHDVWQNHALPSGTVATMSVHAKAQSWSRLMLRDASSNQHAIFYLSGAGSVVLQTAGATAAIQSLSGGWYRLSVAYVVSSATPNMTIRLVDDSGNWSFAGNGSKGVYLWGAQLEASPTVGPYVRTGQNLLPYSESFGSWTQWGIVSTSGSMAPDGSSNAFKINESTSTGTHNPRQSVSYSSNTFYTLSAYVKAAERTQVRLVFCESDGVAAGSADFNLSAATTASGGEALYQSSSITAVGNGYYRCVLTIKTSGNTPSGAGYVDVRLFNGSSYGYTGESGKGVYLWGAQLETASSAGPYIKTPAVGVTSRGGAPTTNRLTYSQQINDASWNKSSVTVSADTTETSAPDGSYTAEKVLETSALSSTHAITRSVTGMNLTKTYTYSIFVKAAGRSRVAFQNFSFPSYSSNYANADIDLATGTIISSGSPSGTTATFGIVNAGNGWWRISVTFNFNNSETTFGPNLYLRDAGGAITYDGDPSKGIYVWGAQLEQSNQPGPYVPTTTAATMGGGQWCNLVALPSDGSPQSAYDFKYGDGSTSATFPAFTGISGGRSANDYFSFDGGDYLSGISVVNTAFINSLHKVNALYTAEIWFKTGSAVSGTQGLLSTRSYASSETGWNISIYQSKINVYVGNGTSAVFDYSTQALSPDTIYHFAFSYDESTGSAIAMLNGVVSTFTSRYGSPATSDAFYPLTVGAAGDRGARFAAGGRICQIRLYNRALSKTELDQNWSSTRSRFGI